VNALLHAENRGSPSTNCNSRFGFSFFTPQGGSMFRARQERALNQDFYQPSTVSATPSTAYETAGLFN
jgi:hypothetical protein